MTTVEPLHPGEVYWNKEALIAIGVILGSLLTAQYLLGHWDYILIHAVDYWPVWKWGG